MSSTGESEHAASASAVSIRIVNIHIFVATATAVLPRLRSTLTPSESISHSSNSFLAERAEPCLLSANSLAVSLSLCCLASRKRKSIRRHKLDCDLCTLIDEVHHSTKVVLVGATLHTNPLTLVYDARIRLEHEGSHHLGDGHLDVSAALCLVAAIP